MKKIFIAAFCVLFAGSAFMQSCSKPDVAKAPDPANPNGPVVPLTERQIIQKAIDKLGSDTFDFTGFQRLITRNKWVTAGVEQVLFTGNTDPYPYLRFPYKTIGKDGFLAASNAPRTGMIRNSLKCFYGKIFTNIQGDSFIGATNRFYDHLEDSNSISRADFHNMEKYKTVAIDSSSLATFLPLGAPTVEVQYYYDKDSLSIFETRTTNIVFSDTLNTETLFHVIYGIKKR